MTLEEAEPFTTTRFPRTGEGAGAPSPRAAAVPTLPCERRGPGGPLGGAAETRPPVVPAGEGRGRSRGGGRGARPHRGLALGWAAPRPFRRALPGSAERGRPGIGHRLRSLVRRRCCPPPVPPYTPSSPHGGGPRGHRSLPPPAPASPFSSSPSARGGGRGVAPGGDVRSGDRRKLTLKYLRSECSWISEQICEFTWKKCCGCSQSLLQTDFNVSVLHHPVLSNRSSAVP